MYIKTWHTHFKNETIRIINHLCSPTKKQLILFSLLSVYANRKYAEYLVTELCKMGRFPNCCRSIPCFSTFLQYVQNSVKASPWATQHTWKEKNNLTFLISLSSITNIDQVHRSTELKLFGYPVLHCFTELQQKHLTKFDHHYLKSKKESCFSKNLMKIFIVSL